MATRASVGLVPHATHGPGEIRTTWCSPCTSLRTWVETCQTAGPCGNHGAALSRIVNRGALVGIPFKRRHKAAPGPKDPYFCKTHVKTSTPLCRWVRRPCPPFPGGRRLRLKRAWAPGAFELLPYEQGVF